MLPASTVIWSFISFHPSKQSSTSQTKPKLKSCIYLLFSPFFLYALSYPHMISQTSWNPSTMNTKYDNQYCWCQILTKDSLELVRSHCLRPSLREPSIVATSLGPFSWRAQATTITWILTAMVQTTVEGLARMIHQARVSLLSRVSQAAMVLSTWILISTHTLYSAMTAAGPPLILSSMECIRSASWLSFAVGSL